MEELLRDWCDDGRDRLGWAAKTEKAYRSAGNCWIRWFVDRNDRPPTPADFTAASLQTFDTYRKRAGRRQVSRAAALCAWQAWARYLRDQGRIGEGECAAIAALQVRVTEKPRRRWATGPQVASLFTACSRVGERHGDGLLYRPALCAAVLAMLAYCGLRRGEVCALALSDVDLRAAVPCVTIRQGKGDKTRVVWLHSQAVAYLRAWLPFRPAGTEYLFAAVVNGRVKPLTEYRLIGILKELCEVAAIADASPLVPHAFRRFAATSLLKVKGCTLAHVRDFLGHSDIQTTIQYIGMDTQELQRLVMQLEVEKPDLRLIEAPARRRIAARRQA